jgi:hypothetical protein
MNFNPNPKHVELFVLVQVSTTNDLGYFKNKKLLNQQPIF